VEAVLAVIVGIAFGSALAALVAIPLRRRRRSSQTLRAGRTRRIPFERPEQRHRAAWIAAGFALSGTIAQAAGWSAIAAYLMLGAIVLAAQTAMSAALARSRKQ
jgi:hypothetical protein